MSRIINPDSAGKERSRLSRGVVLAVRELAKQSGPGAEARDLAAFIALALEVIARTIEASVGAWEKRGYWVKADRFRMDWSWAALYARKMRQAVLDEDWVGVAQVAAQTAEKLGKVNVPDRHHLGEPWVGAWQELRSQK